MGDLDKRTERSLKRILAQPIGFKKWSSGKSQRGIPYAKATEIRRVSKEEVLESEQSLIVATRTRTEHYANELTRDKRDG